MTAAIRVITRPDKVMNLFSKEYRFLNTSLLVLGVLHVFQSSIIPTAVGQAANTTIIRSISPAVPVISAVRGLPDNAVLVTPAPDQSNAIVQATASGAQAQSAGNTNSLPRLEQEFLNAILKAEFDRTEEAIFRAMNTEAPVEPEIDRSLLDQPDPGQSAEPVQAAESSESAEVPEQQTDGETGDTDAGTVESAEAAETGEPGEDQPASDAPAQVGADAADAAAIAAAEAEKKQKQDKAHADWAAWRVAVFQRAVTLGDWDYCGEVLNGLSDESALKVYRHLLTALGRPPRQQPPKPVDGQPVVRVPSQHHYDHNDILALADLCPAAPEDADVNNVAALLRQRSMENRFSDALIQSLDNGTRWYGGDSGDGRQRAARLLIESGMALSATAFLPDTESALMDGSVSLLDLLARLREASYAKERDKNLLLDAWKINLAILDRTGSDEKPIRDAALTRALDLSLKLEDESANQWLSMLIEEKPEQAREVFAAIGASVVEMRPVRSPEPRLDGLRLQRRAVEILLEKSPELAGRWTDLLGLMALNWLHEASQTEQLDTSTSRGPAMNFDVYGNVYYSNQPVPRNNNTPVPVSAGDILRVAPEADWLAFVPAGIRPGFAAVLARLHLRVKELDESFPFIEEVARSYPEQGRDLVDEFLRVWIENNDPNSDLNRRSSYLYIYGYNRRQDAIPLTRSKQERSLEDLSRQVARLRELPVPDLDEELLMRAFTVTHSVAEVYKIGDLEKVFGDIRELKPSTLAQLVQTMRRNLAGVWRQPQTQDTSETGRSDAELQAEVFRGYKVANEVLSRGLEKSPDSWELQLARATMLFDENTYRYELTRDSEFSERRSQAFGEFANAAGLYRQALPGLKETEESVDPYLIWFHAALGASELSALRDFHQPSPKQIGLIRSRIHELPGEAGERHLARFANDLTTQITQVNAELKHRYLKYGLEIAGDHEKADRARRQFEYYADLVREIRLDARLDGTSDVGHTAPFGLFIDLRHTREVEREAGGFQKYLQNQNASGFYYFNYGRPNEDYRDKFETSLRENLRESFEVYSVTFHSDKVQSQGDPEEGWRRTPYAYVLLRSLGPEVDAIPPVQMDLDFNDTSGYVVLPVASPMIPLNSRPSGEPARVFSNLRITQNLDERESETGLVTLEVKATAHGLVPDFETILDLSPREFVVDSIDDQGVAVTQVDPADPRNAPVTERIWSLTLKPRPGLNKYPTHFQFASAKLDGTEMLYQKYEDADLAAVPAEVRIQQQYGQGTPMWAVGLIFAAILAAGGLVYWLLRPRPVVSTQNRNAFALPSDLNPFTVVALLRKIRSTAALPEPAGSELDQIIRRLEEKYFRLSQMTEPDPQELQNIAAEWIRRSAA